MGRVRLPRFKSAPVLAKSSPPFFFFLNRHLHFLHIVSDYPTLIYSHIHLIHSLFIHSYPFILAYSKIQS